MGVFAFNLIFLKIKVLVLNTVFNYAGLNVEDHVVFDKRLLRPHEVPLLLGDAKKANDKLGWSPKIKFNDLAKMMYNEDLRREKNENCK